MSTTIAQLEEKVIELEGRLNRMSSTVKLVTGLNPDEVWVSTRAAAIAHGISLSHLRQLLANAEDRRISGKATQLQYGVHYRQKAGTPERQINAVKFAEWFNLPPELRDQ